MQRRSNIIDEKIINLFIYIVVHTEDGESLSTKIKHVKLNSIPDRIVEEELNLPLANW